MIYFTSGKSLGNLGERLYRNGALPLPLNLLSEKDVINSVSGLGKKDVIIHAAGMSSIDECENNKNKAFAVNMRGTILLCGAAERYGITRIVLLSTEQVFGGWRGYYDENCALSPINDYGRTKQGAEEVIKAYDYKILRLSRMISSNDHDIVRIAEGGADVPVFIRRSYTHIDFASKAVMEYAERYDEMPSILHYGSSKPVSYYSLAKMLNPRVVARWMPERGYTPRPYNCGLNVSLAKKLGLSIQTSRQAAEMTIAETAKKVETK